MKKGFLLLSFLLFSTYFFAQESERFIEITNLDINSSYADFGMTFYKNDMVLFVSSRKEENVKLKERSRNRMQHLHFYKGLIGDDGQIIFAGRYSLEKFNMFYESDITFMPDGKTIFFTLNNFIDDEYAGEFKKSSKKNHILNIFRATIDDAGIATNITALPINSSEYSVHNPRVSPDGKELYYVSDSEEGFGEDDIYKITLHEDGTYGIPENLGPTINTKGREVFPFLSINNILYFSSDGQGGKGYLDIFSSNYNRGIYDEAKNVGSKINSIYDDFSFAISPKKGIGYFSSTRKGKGGADIFRFKIKPLECNQLIAGVLKNKLDDSIISNATIQLLSNGQIEQTATTDQNGVYAFEVACEKSYLIKVQKDAFTDIEKNFITSNINDFQKSHDLFLAPLDCKQIIVGTVVSKETLMPLLNVELALYLENTLLEKTYSQIGGVFQFELEVDCEKSYLIKAQKDTFTDIEKKFITSNINHFQKSYDLFLAPLDCKQTIVGTVVSKETLMPLLNVELALYHENILLERAYSQIGGIFQFELEVDCEKSYLIKAQKDAFTDIEKNFIISNINDFHESHNLFLAPLDCKQTIAGTVVSKETLMPLLNVELALYHENTLLERTYSQIGGVFQFELEVDCEKSYLIKAQKDAFTNIEKNFTTSNINDFQESYDLFLAPLDCKQTITGTVLSEETLIPLLNVELALYHENTLLERTYSQIGGVFQFEIEVDCNTDYEVKAEVLNYLPTFKDITTTDIFNKTMDIKISMKEFQDFVTIRNVTMIQTDPIHFDLNDFSIRKDAAIELDKVVEMMINHPEIKVEVGSHTDSRAPDAYNMRLSEDRANSTMAYIISKGINPNRISGKGYGETQLINKCSNGVKCSEAEHQTNRRTEFIVINE